MQPILIQRRNLEAHVARTDKSNSGLNVIRFEDDKSVSSDGKLLMIVPYQPEPMSEFPGTVEPRPGDGITEGVNIPLASVEKVAKMLPKRQTRPILENAMLHGVTNGETVFSTTDLDTVNDMTVQNGEQQFPDVGRTLSEIEANDGQPMCLQLSVLEKLIKALKKAQATAVVLVPGKPEAAIRFEARHDEKWATDEGIRGAIMPITVR